MKFTRILYVMVAIGVFAIGINLAQAQGNTTTFSSEFISNVIGYPDLFGYGQGELPNQILLLETTPEPVPNAGDCDGTIGNDVIVCSSNPTTPDTDAYMDLGNDELSIGQGVTVTHVLGDGIPGGFVSRTSDGGDDTITNEGTITYRLHGDDVVNSSGGDDIISNTNTGSIGDSVRGDELRVIYSDSTIYGGNDTITNQGFIGLDIVGDDIAAYIGINSVVYGGDDLIINNGSVSRYIFGDHLSHSANNSAFAGEDHIVNTGTVGSNIYGDNIYQAVLTGQGASDTIINSGTIGGTIFAEGGDDTVILQTGANGGADNNLPINGGTGTDTLYFAFTNLSQSTINAINSANPASGNITINGQTFTWTNFESLSTQDLCPDGTTSGDVLECLASPPTGTNTNNDIEAGVGIDQITINNGVTVNEVMGDGIPGDSETRYSGNGSNDTIINNGTVSLGIHGDFVSGNGGNDTIINNNSVNVIIGDSTYEGNSGDDIITNNGNASWIMGDGVNNGNGGDDTITNTSGSLVEILDGDEISISNPSLTISGGDDHITNQTGAIAYIISGDAIASSDTAASSVITAGNDTIINNGIVSLWEGQEGNIFGDVIDNRYGNISAGQDIITNTGAIEGNIYGDYVYDEVEEPNGEGASDTITNSGTVGGTIFAEGGDDTVILQDGANGGADNNLLLDGGTAMRCGTTKCLCLLA